MSSNTASVPNNRMMNKSNNVAPVANVRNVEPQSEPQNVMAFFNKYKWYILAVLIVVIAVVAYQYYNPFESKLETSTTESQEASGSGMMNDSPEVEDMTPPESNGSSAPDVE